MTRMWRIMLLRCTGSLMPRYGTLSWLLFMELMAIVHKDIRHEEDVIIQESVV